MVKKSKKESKKNEEVLDSHYCPNAKTYVLDTNVLIHDPNALNSFGDNDVVLPRVVIKELDKKKKGDDIAAQSAREVSRTIRELIESNLGFNYENEFIIPLGKSMGNLKIISWTHDLATIQNEQDFGDDNDGKILSIAYQQKLRYSKGEDKCVVFVTKDNNAALMAAGKIKVEDYSHDQVRNVDLLFPTISTIDIADLQETTEKSDFKKNQPILLEEKSSIYRNNGKRWIECKVKKIGSTSLKPKSLEQRYAVDVLMDPTISCCALIGAAGSGKTLLAVACALAQADKYRLKIARAAVELSGNSMGFLPGNLDDKYDPYFAPIRDACRVIMESSSKKSEDYVSASKNKKASKKQKNSDEDELKLPKDKSDQEVKTWMQAKGVDAVYMNVIRGRTFNNTILIVDEAQNLTPNEIKTIVTRAGKGTKIVFTGDVHQIDHRWLTSTTNGLSYLIDRFDGEDFFAYIKLPTSERSELAEAADKLL